MSSLVYLNLRNNLIYDPSKSLFSNLSDLQFLILSENKLESIEKQFFYGLKNLKYLDLTKNQLKFIFRDSYQEIYNLENLYLKFNFINNLNGSLRILKKLSTLDLSSNKLESFKIDDILSNISNLDLSFNLLKQFEFNQSYLFGLKTLKMSSTNSSLISNIDFKLFLELEELDLSDNLNINIEMINKLVKLRKLNIRNTNANDCSFIKNLKSIEELDVGDNRNYYFCLRFLSNSLKSLKISNVSLRENICMINKLIYLDASYNNITTMEFVYIESLNHLDLKFNYIDNIMINLKTNFNFHKLYHLSYISLFKSLTKYLTEFEIKFGYKLELAVLSNNNLRIFPKFCELDDSQQEIFDISCNLKILFFDHNKLEKIKPTDFLFLVNLQYLNLDSNSISLIADNSFFNLRSLETLILSNNNINLENNTSSIFNALTNIKFLNLSFNFIEFIGMYTFQNLLKLEVIDLSHNKIHSIKHGSFKGLINLRELYINANEPNLKIENSSFSQFEAIKTIYIDKFILNDSYHKSIFIYMIENKNFNHKKTILKWSFFQAFNLITLNESFYDCNLVFEFIRFNIQYNLKTESHFNDFLSNCQSSYLKKKYLIDYIIQENKLSVNYLYLFLVMLSFIFLVALIWSLFSFIDYPHKIEFNIHIIFDIKNFLFNLIKCFLAKTKKLFFWAYSRLGN